VQPVPGSQPQTPAIASTALVPIDDRPIDTTTSTPHHPATPDTTVHPDCSHSTDCHVALPLPRQFQVLAFMAPQLHHWFSHLRHRHSHIVSQPHRAPVRSPFDMSFLRPPAPVGPPNSGLPPRTGRQPSSNNVSTTLVLDVSPIGHPVAPIAPIMQPSTTRSETTTLVPSTTSMSTGSVTTASPVRRSSSPKGIVLGSSVLVTEDDKIMSDSSSPFPVSKPNGTVGPLLFPSFHR
jgi:hypothetical protein